MPLLNLPNELLIQIGKELNPMDLDYFIRTNRHLAILLTPILHRIAAHVVLNMDGDMGGDTVLIWAINNYHEKLIGSLLDHGSDIESVGWMQWTPLTVAAAIGDVAAVRLLIDRGAIIAPQYTAQPLHCAAMNGQIETAKVLLEKGADIETTQTDNGSTPLCWAILHGQGGFSKFLLEKGANVNARNSSGETALQIAAGLANEEIFLELCDKGADVTLSSPEMTVLHTALGSGRSERVIRTLLERGADIVAKTSTCSTLLHYAIDGDASEKIFQLLLDAGAEVCVNVRDISDGQTPLLRVSRDNERHNREYHNKEKMEDEMPGSSKKGLKESLRKLSIEFETNREAIVRALVNKGADIHATDLAGETSLHGAARNGYAGIAKFLLENGAEVSARDDGNFMALHRAAEGSFEYRYKDNSGHIAVMRMLLERGADINAYRSGEGTVREWATPGNKSLRDLLEEMGLDVEELKGYESDNMCGMGDGMYLSGGEYHNLDYDYAEWSADDDDDDDENDSESDCDENSWDGFE